MNTNPEPSRHACRRTLPFALAACLLAAGASPALALPPGGGGGGCAPDCPPPTTGPKVATLYSMTPSFGWSGDAVRFQGKYLVQNVSVTVNGTPATVVSTNGGVSSRSYDIVDVVIPPITSSVVGPVQVAVVLTSSYGSVSQYFTLSPTLEVSAGADFNQSAAIGFATATLDVDRASGFVHGTTTVNNLQAFPALTVNVTAVWADAQGRVIGFTPVHATTGTGVFFHWPASESVTTTVFNDMMTPNPGVAPFIHSGQVIIVRDHGAELQQTLTDAVALGQTIASVVQTVAGFL